MNITPTPDRSGSGSNRRFRRATAVGLTAGLLGGGAVGLLAAAPSFTSAASSQFVLQDTDTGTDTSTDTGTDSGSTDERPDRALRVREALQELVDAGTITAEQADSVAAHLAEQMPDRGGRGHGHGGGRGVVGTVVADALGITTEELRTALADGQTIAEIAAAEGVDVQVVIDAMIAEVEQRLDEKVADGTLTQAEADTKLTEATERITERVNTAGPVRMGRGPAGDDA